MRIPESFPVPASQYEKRGQHYETDFRKGPILTCICSIYIVDVVTKRSEFLPIAANIEYRTPFTL